MKIIKADNYQTWYLEHLDSAVLIDPWLTNTLQPEGTFFIQRRKKNPICLSENQINKNSKKMYFFFIENILLSLLFFLTCILYECRQKLDNLFKSSQEHR